MGQNLSTAVIVVFVTVWTASAIVDLIPTIDYSASPVLHAGMTAIIGAATGHKILGEWVQRQVERRVEEQANDRR